jgi:catechol 2,3-dioxygenase-like lactoylglutathione lyase family enzyme
MDLAINHVTILSEEPERLQDWYVDKLDFLREDERMLWAGESLLNINGGRGMPADFHFGFRLSSKDELRKVFDELKERDVEITLDLGDYGSYAMFYVADLDGNTLEFFYQER